jgi:hypothetical protein
MIFGSGIGRSSNRLQRNGNKKWRAEWCPREHSHCSATLNPRPINTKRKISGTLTAHNAKEG